MVVSNFERKIKEREELKEIIKDLKAANKKVVHTSGVFDIIHEGHIFILNEAKKLGDILVVSLNSDESIKRFKGKNRPILNETARTTVMAALEMVDYVTVFPEDEIIKTLQILRPDIHVKGRGVIESRIAKERECMESMGCKMICVPFDAGNSTTAIIRKVMGAYRNEQI